VAWISSDSTIVRVHPKNGWIRAIRPGQAHVVARSGEDRDSALIMVRPARARAVGSLAITPIAPLRVGDSAAMQAVVLDDRGSATVDSFLTWRSSQPSIVTIDGRTGEVRAHAPGMAVIIARGSVDSAFADVTVLPAPVAGVIIQGARPLAVGETLGLLGVPVDAEGRALRDRLIAWMSSDTTVLEVDAMTGVITALSPGAVDVTAMSDEGSGRARVTVFARDNARREKVDAAILAGVDECYGALLAKDADRVARLYHPASGTDAENLKKLRRILRTREWSAIVGERTDGEWQTGGESAAMQFSVRLTWKDATGARRDSEPVLRAEFARSGGRWAMASCRIVGSPDL